MHVWSNYWPCDWIQSLAHLHYLEVSCPKPQPSNHVIDLSSMLGPHPESSHEHKLRYGRDLSWITKNHSGNSKDTVLTSGEEPGTRTRQILYCTTHDIRVLQDLPSAIPPRLTQPLHCSGWASWNTPCCFRTRTSAHAISSASICCLLGLSSELICQNPGKQLHLCEPSQAVNPSSPVLEYSSFTYWFSLHLCPQATIVVEIAVCTVGTQYSDFTE